MWDEAVWEEFVKECEGNTREGFFAIPGVRFKDLETGQEFGFVNPLRSWPRLNWLGLAFTSLIRISGPGGGEWRGALLFPLFPKRGGVPFWVHGSIDAFPVECIGRKGREEGFVLLLMALCDGWGFLPVAYKTRRDEGVSLPPGGVQALPATYNPLFHLLGPNPGEARGLLSQPLAGKGEKEVRVRFSIRSEAPLSKVEVYLNREVLKVLRPERGAFQAEFMYRTSKGGRLILVAEDRGGGRMICPGPGVDVRVYRAFIGTDRMNGYWLVERPERVEKEGDWVRDLRAEGEHKEVLDRA